MLLLKGILANLGFCLSWFSLVSVVHVCLCGETLLFITPLPPMGLWRNRRATFKDLFEFALELAPLTNDPDLSSGGVRISQVTTMAAFVSLTGITSLFESE